MRRLKGSERTDWSTEPEASFSPEQFQANECTFFLWPRYSLVSRPPGQSLMVRSMCRARRGARPSGGRREDRVRTADYGLRVTRGLAPTYGFVRLYTL